MFKYFLTFVIILGLYACSTNKVKQKENFNAGIIYGKGHAFFLTAPKGWVLDNSSGVSHGLHAVFYLEGNSWSNGTSVMYANTTLKEIQGDEPVEKVIEGDISRFKANSPNLNVIDAAPLLTRDNKKCIVKYFSGDIHGNYEAVAYIDERKVVVMIVLTSRKKEEFDLSLPAFKELVASYQFITDDVRIEKWVPKIIGIDRRHCSNKAETGQSHEGFGY